MNKESSIYGLISYIFGCIDEKVVIDDEIRLIFGRFFCHFIENDKKMIVNGGSDFINTLSKFPIDYITNDHLSMILDKLYNAKTKRIRNFYVNLTYYLSGSFEERFKRTRDDMKKLAFDFVRTLELKIFDSITYKQKMLDSIEKFRNCCDCETWFSTINNGLKNKMYIFTAKKNFSHSPNDIIKILDLDLNPNLIIQQKTNDSILETAFNSQYNSLLHTGDLIKKCLQKGSYLPEGKSLPSFTFEDDQTTKDDTETFLRKRKTLNLKNLVIDCVFKHGIYESKLPHFFYRYKGLDDLWQKVEKDNANKKKGSNRGQKRPFIIRMVQNTNNKQNK